MKRANISASRKRGFTVLEMTMALALSLGIASALIGLLQQQISFTQALNNFRFLRDDAPQINTLLTNIINKADNYRIYPDIGNAKALSGAVRSGGTCVRLRFRNPDGTSDHSIVAFEVVDGKKQLNYYFRGSAANTWPTSPTWTISQKPDVISFGNSTGILLVTLTGPQGEEITYAGNPD